MLCRQVKKSPCSRCCPGWEPEWPAVEATNSLCLPLRSRHASLSTTVRKVHCLDGWGLSLSFWPCFSTAGYSRTATQGLQYRWYTWSQQLLESSPVLLCDAFHKDALNGAGLEGPHERGVYSALSVWVGKYTTRLSKPGCWCNRIIPGPAWWKVFVCK